jgi:CRP/FNR family transcriptional regulator, cyclic AMP receptor protein
MEKSIMETSLDDLFSRYPILSYDKEQVIIHGDDSPSGVFYVKSGFVKMSVILETGRELTLNIFKPGACFPMFWAIANIPNTYFYKTYTPTVLQKAPREILLEFMKNNPDALFELTKRILRGVSGLLINIEHQLSGDSYHRVIAALVLSTNRFGVKGEKGLMIIKLPMTHQDIADIAGITRETVSLSMEKLTRKKIISYKGRTLIINDIKALNKESMIINGEKPTPDTL